MRTTEQLVKLARQLSSTAERLPGASLVQKEYEIIEDAVLQSVHHRMRRAISRSPEDAPALAPPKNNTNNVVFEDHSGLSPSQRLQSIMDEALEQSMEQAVVAWAHRTLDQLLPDEVRVLSALSSGDAHATIGVSATRSIAGSREVLLCNISSVGKSARVKVRDLVPAYVARLKALGLAETRGANTSLELEYQILESDTQVLRAISEAQTENYSRIRVDRGTLRISPTGQRLWEICSA